MWSSGLGLRTCDLLLLVQSGYIYSLKKKKETPYSSGTGIRQSNMDKALIKVQDITQQSNKVIVAMPYVTHQRYPWGLLMRAWWKRTQFQTGLSGPAPSSSLAKRRSYPLLYPHTQTCKDIVTYGNKNYSWFSDFQKSFICWPTYLKFLLRQLIMSKKKKEKKSL